MIIMQLPLKHPVTRALFAGLFAVSLTACAPSIAGTDLSNNNGGNNNQNGSQNGETDAPSLVKTSESNGVFTSIIDADSQEKDAWTYFSFDGGKQVTPETPEDSQDWDLAFLSTGIRANGGVSGKGMVSAVRVTGVSFDELTEAPASGYLSDAADGDDAGTALDSAFHLGEAWYAYDGATHVVSVRDHVYVVQANSGRFYKMQIAKYYDDAGNARVLTVKWAELDAPFPRKEVAGPATDGYTYLSLRTGDVLSFADETAAKASTDWDLALSGTKIRTNSGTSGAGAGGALLTDATNFTTLAEVPAGTFSGDTEITYAGHTPVTTSGNSVLQDWYDYNSSTHAVTSKGQVYIVKTADGRHAKLRIVAYASGKATLEWHLADGVSTTF